jgi:hypothetical protein
MPAEPYTASIQIDAAPERVYRTSRGRRRSCAGWATTPPSTPRTTSSTTPTTLQRRDQKTRLDTVQRDRRSHCRRARIRLPRDRRGGGQEQPAHADVLEPRRPLQPRRDAATGRRAHARHVAGHGVAPPTPRSRPHWASRPASHRHLAAALARRAARSGATWRSFPSENPERSAAAPAGGGDSALPLRLSRFATASSGPDDAGRRLLLSGQGRSGESFRRRCRCSSNGTVSGALRRAPQTAFRRQVGARSTLARRVGPGGPVPCPHGPGRRAPKSHDPR